MFEHIRLRVFLIREGELFFCEGEFPISSYLPMADFFKSYYSAKKVRNWFYESSG